MNNNITLIEVFLLHNEFDTLILYFAADTSIGFKEGLLLVLEYFYHVVLILLLKSRI